jgi:hypothetical protein
LAKSRDDDDSFLWFFCVMHRQLLLARLPLKWRHCHKHRKHAKQ